MIFRGIDGVNDWAFGDGRASYLTEEAAIDANIRTRLLTFLGECFFALDAGVDWENLLGGKNPQAMVDIILQCRTIIAASFGVVRVIEVAPQFHPETRALTLVYSIDSIYTKNITQSIQPST